MAVLMATAIGSTSLRAACQPDAAASNPPGGVKLQVIAFGDSLLDVGTYAKFAKATFGGGEFTTNPSKIFVEDLACQYGDVIIPAFQGGLGRPLEPTGGFGYAQGGSRVSMQPGIFHAPAGTPNADFAELTTIPVTEQLNEYLAVYQRFHPNQLVVIDGGANDIILNLQIAQEEGTVQAQQAAVTAINQSAVDLANIVDTVVAKGATHVVLLNMPDLGTTPLGVSSSDQGKSFTQLSQVFNTTLQSELTQRDLLDKIVLMDTFGIINNVITNFRDFGFQVTNTVTACNLQAQVEKATEMKLNDPIQFGESLYCSSATFATSTAPEDFMFADTVHPTTHLSAIFAKAVEQQVATSLAQQ
jgi:phospholipase/lecithinase/hemolysin